MKTGKELHESRIGRPTLKTPELCAEICRRISEGETLTNICRDPGMPSWVSRRRFLAYATRPERFLKLVSDESTFADGPIRWISRQQHRLHVKLRLSAKPIRAEETELFVLGHDLTGALRCLRTHPVRSSYVGMFDCVTNQRLGLARYRGSAFAAELTIPIDIFSPAHALFVKLERRLWFFDEVGWLEIPPPVRPGQIPAPKHNFVELCAHLL
jgi:hypothetical protein